MSGFEPQMNSDGSGYWALAIGYHLLGCAMPRPPVVLPKTRHQAAQ
jgi:hypothetical protein